MAAFISKKLSFNNAEQFKESFFEPEPATLGYVFIGNHTPWPNEDNVPEIYDTVQNQQDIWDNMYAAKKVTGNDVELVIPRHEWTGNTRYRAFDDQITQDDLLSANTEQALQPFYVLTSERNVYICLSNNVSSNSTVEPSGDYNSANGFISTADGYLWKYMYNIKPSNKFFANSWIPAPVSTSKLDYNVSTANIIDGALVNIIVLNGGSGYATPNISANPFSAATNRIALENITNVTANMSIEGTGIAPLSYITAISNTTNTVTISTSTIGSGGGTGNNVTISTRLGIVGDGAGALATAQLSGNSIYKINLTGYGDSYTHANVNVYGSGTGAQLRAIIGPKNGHGYNPAKELGASNVMISTKIGQIDSTEGGVISTDTTFRQYGLLRDPYKYDDTKAANTTSSNTVISQTTDLTLVAGPGYELNEFVYQGSPTNASYKGFVHAQVSNQVRLTKVQGTLTLGGALIGANSSTSRIAVKVKQPEFQPYTGDILYVENITKAQRAEGQAENLRLVIQF